MTIKPKKIYEITVPPSKSYLHRALIGAFLCKDKCHIKNIYHSQDIDTTIKALESLNKNDIINCNECASTLRFLIPLSLVINSKGAFCFEESLGKRPLEEYLNIFDTKGIKYSKNKDNLVVQGNLKPKIYNIQGNVSSQFLTGLLLALPLLKGNSEIHIEQDLQSRPYIDITLDILKDFGIEIENQNYKFFKIKGNQEYKCKEYACEGDWSTGAFWYFLSQKYNINEPLLVGLRGAKRPWGGRLLKINNLNTNSIQPDAQVTKITPNLPKVYNAKDTPDLVPLIVAYAIGTNQEIKITDCERLKYKESNRLLALKEFEKIGGKIKIDDNSIIIDKSQSLKSGFLNSFHDHRIVMAYALFSFLTNIKIETDDIDCLKKSYPELIDIIKG